MHDFTLHDELWHNIAILQPGTEHKVLFRAMSAREQRGTGKMEDIIFCTRYGKGRGFYNALGHDTKATESPGFRLLMLRGTEWAATGGVTINSSAFH